VLVGFKIYVWLGFPLGEQLRYGLSGPSPIPLQNYRRPPPRPRSSRSPPSTSMTSSGTRSATSRYKQSLEHKTTKPCDSLLGSRRCTSEGSARTWWNRLSAMSKSNRTATELMSLELPPSIFSQNSYHNTTHNTTIPDVDLVPTPPIPTTIPDGGGSRMSGLHSAGAGRVASGCGLHGHRKTSYYYLRGTEKKQII